MEKSKRKNYLVWLKIFTFKDVHTKVEPLFMLYDPDWFNIIFVRYKEGQLSGALKVMKR